MKQAILLFSIILTLTIRSYAQDLHLSSGNSKKTIKAGTFIEIDLLPINQDPCDDCALNKITGQLISYADGKLNLRMKSMLKTLLENGNNVGYTSRTYSKKDNAPLVSIPRDSVISITIKGKKRVNEHTAGETIGIVLYAMGSAHIFSAPFIVGTAPDETKTLLWLGLAEATVGMTLGLLFQQKPLITSSDYCLLNNESYKIWSIN